MAEEKKEENDFSFITQNLIIGNWACAGDEKFLKEHKVAKVVCMTPKLPDDDRLEVYKKLEVDYRVEPLSEFEKADDPDDCRLVQRTLAQVAFVIDLAVEKDQVVLVHCRQGKDRSALAAVNYLRVTRNLTVDEAVSEVKKKREKIDIREEYLTMLRRRFR